jgi:type IV pilus assembly protein PilY1
MRVTRQVSFTLGLLVVIVTMFTHRAAAQNDPDLRQIIPYMMLVIDTSGSMERLTSCTCTTQGCLECLPDCSLPNDGNGLPPKSAPPQSHDLKKNRWATTLEALTGGFNNFECSPLARNTTNGMTYDIGYQLPYHQPWHCTGQLPNTACAYNAAGVSTLSQNDNGIIDQYSSSIQFGLMTFDGKATYGTASDLVPANPPDTNGFNRSLSDSVQGMWSYAGPHSFHYPNCTTDYMIDTGARSAVATEGGLVSLNSCTGVRGSTTCQAWCSQCPGTQKSINDDIQAALLKSRPFGGTPIAASLDDLYYHLKNDLTDTFGNCRNRFALLMTDGYPDADYRDFGCDCQTTESPSSPNYCGGDPRANEPGLFHCPYPKPEQVATDLIHGRTNDKAMIQQLFVVGLAVDDTNVIGRLDSIAHAGCPNATGCDPDGDGHEALFANDVNHLLQNLHTVMEGLLHPVSRSVPAFAAGGTEANINQKQFQVSTGFQVATTAQEPWTGVIERKRFTCSSGTLTENAIDTNSGDVFQDVLNQQGNRTLFTAAPTGANLDGALYKGASGAPCGSGCSPQLLRNLQPAQLGLATTDMTGMNNVLDWMEGKSGTARANKRLGDVYHSSPVIMGVPRFDTADDAFNRFRQQTTPVSIVDRPLTLFVASNDGILHAFSMDDWSVPSSSLSYRAGEEMWGFVPPLLLNDISNNLNGHQFTLDGTPVVKNVYFNRPTSGADVTNYDYHTVLIIGMRGGGNAYVALDVTDVLHPAFLWQFTDPHMGNTFAQAAIGQATFIDNSSGSDVVKRGAVAILPGGVGELGESGIAGDCTNHATNPSMRDPNTSQAFISYLDVPVAGNTMIGSQRHRSDVRCWKDKGRALYFVDVETGRLLKKIHTDSAGRLVFPSPLVSTPALFENDIGTVASRAFITDADGVIWRVDLTGDPSTYQDENALHQKPLTGWNARPFHDVFFGMQPGDGELSYEAPILTSDPNANLVVIVGTGDSNNFVKPTVANRVVSLTEVPDPTGQPGYKAAVNWEVRMDQSKGLSFVPSELVTGTMGLFNGQLYFGTFMAVSGSDACDLGKGRIHAVDYLARDTNVVYSSPATYGPKRLSAAELGLDTGDAAVVNVDAAHAVTNFMAMGLGVTERPTCQVLDPENFSVWGAQSWDVKTVSQPSIYLVAQASGSSGASSLVQNRQGSKMGSIQLKLNKKLSLSRLTSWATSVD